MLKHFHWELFSPLLKDNFSENINLFYTAAKNKKQNYDKCG
jgi:hypothetical protein